MPLVLAGATSGQATVQATDAQTVTITLPATSGTLVTTGGAQTIEFADGSASAPSITNSGDTNTGMFFPAADTIAFTEGGTEAMRLTSAGNVGVGTTAPISKFDVVVTDGSFTTINPTTGTNNALSAGIRILGANNNTTRSVGIFNYNEGSVDNNHMVFYTNLGSTNTEKMRITGGGQVGIGTTSPNSLLNVSAASNAVIELTATGGGPFRHYLRTAGDDLQIRASSGVMQFYTGATDGISSTERMRITSTGYLKASPDSSYDGGSTSLTHLLEAPDSQNTTVARIVSKNSSTYTGNILILVGFRTTTNSTYNLINATNNNSSGQFIVRDSGNVQNTTGTYGAFSDVKLKENIVDATPKLEKLNQVRIVNYNLKNNPQQKLLGVVAQELEQIFPNMVEEAIDRDADDNDLGTTTKSVKYSVFVPMLIKAMQEQQAIITDLKARIETLENK
jgi:hypothetical protein